MSRLNISTMTCSCEMLMKSVLCQVHDLLFMVTKRPKHTIVTKPTGGIPSCSAIEVGLMFAVGL